jgi:uncharacterized protein RhaS with RHS repeats
MRLAIQESGNYSFIQAYTSRNQLSGWSYDQAGNVLADAMANAYVYDAEGKATYGAGATYYYDPEGKRVEKSGAAYGRPHLSMNFWTRSATINPLRLFR